MIIVVVKAGRQFQNCFLMLCCFLILFYSLPLHVFADPSGGTGGTGASGGEDEGIEVVGSLYEVSTSLTSYINAVVGGNGTDQHNWDGSENFVESPKTAGNAGAYVGYGDKKNSFAASITASSTNSSSSSSYKAWQNLFTQNESTSPKEYVKNAAYQYVRYGRTLTEAGWDTQGVKGSRIRMLTGGLAFVAWGASESIPIMFNFSLKILKWTNPFQLFSLVKSRATVKGEGTATDAVQKSTGVDTKDVNVEDATGNIAGVDPDNKEGGFKEADDAAKEDGNPIYNMMHNGTDSLAGYVSNLYETIYVALSWQVVVPLLIAISIAQVLLMKASPSSTLLNVSKRIIFIAIGIPLMAGLYTMTINKLEEETSKHPASSRIVAASFCDFGSWVDYNRLGFPVGGNWIRNGLSSSPNGKDGATTEGGTISAVSLRGLRRMTLKLNEQIEAVPADLGNLNGNNKTADVHSGLSGAIWKKNAAGTGYGGSVEGAEDTDKSVQNSLYRMLSAYSSGSTYSPAMWATSVSNEFQELAQKHPGDDILGYNGMEEDERDTVHAMFDSTDQVTDWMNRSKEDNESIWAADSDLEWANKEFNIFSDGYLSSKNKPENTMKWRKTPLGKPGLSRMSMYNYLSTSFTESSVVVYSNANSVSDYTKEEHFVVNLIGSGIMKWLYFVNMLVVAGLLALIGFSYSFSMAINGVKNGMRLLVSIPISMLGVVRGIAQVLSLLFVMLGEIIASIFMYTFVSDMFIVFATMVETIATDSEVTQFSTILGGRLFMNVLHVDPLVVSNCKMSVMLMILFETLMVASVGSFMWHYRTAYAMAWDRVSMMAYQLVLFPEVEDVPVSEGFVGESFGSLVCDRLCLPCSAGKAVFGEI